MTRSDPTAGQARAEQEPLDVVEPARLYAFAREAGLLADPDEPPPRRFEHRLPPVRVRGAEGEIAVLPECVVETRTSFKLRFPSALVAGGTLPIVWGDHVLPGGFYHQTVWMTDAAGRSNLDGRVALPPLPIVDVPLERAQLIGYSSHWGHFFTDTLDRLLAAADAGDLDLPMLTDGGEPCRNALEMLTGAGIIDRPLTLYPLRGGALFRVRNLEVRSLTSLKPAAPVESLERLRRAARCTVVDATVSDALPLFVGRKAVTLRKLTGQDELAVQLDARGLARTVYPELLPGIESMRTFARHRRIVLAIGSAKFNLAFCAPGTRVTCVAPRGYAEGNGPVCQLLRHICGALSLDLDFYSCASTPSSGERAHMLLHHDIDFRMSDMQRILGAE